MYNDGDVVGFFAIVSKPDADLAVVEENIKQELKKKTTFHQKIPMHLEVSTLVKYSKK
jgi:hypothetical protein